jgi:anaerobic selenocysteine-containing dehydrogenase
MAAKLKRRDFLKASAAMAAASAAGGFSCVEIASAAPIVPPVVDTVSVRVLIDGAYNFVPASRPSEGRQNRARPAIIAVRCTTNGACRSISNRNVPASSTL